MLPPLLDIGEIHRRLQVIFPEGTPQRRYCTREMAARTVFVMLYVGAVEGSGLWMGPKYVYRMGEGQSGRRNDAERLGGASLFPITQAIDISARFRDIGLELYPCK